VAPPNSPLPRVSATAGTWSVWLAVGSFLVVIVLQTVWGYSILMPQWKLVEGEPDPAYIAQYNVGTALFSGTGLVLAIAAILFGAKSIGGAKPFPRDQSGRKAAVVRGWIGMCLGTLLVLYSIMVASYIW